MARRVVRRGERIVYPETRDPAQHWVRIVMNRAIDDHIATLDPSQLSAAEISGTSHAHRPWKSYRSLEHPEFDLLADVPADLCFDVVICEQVLEHVERPWVAARNLRELCAPGGHVIVTCPFLIRVHELPYFGMKDYWRFTPRGLRLLLEDVGLEVDTIGHWGNRRCVEMNLEWWSAYKPWLSLRDEPDAPVQVWAFARRTK